MAGGRPVPIFHNADHKHLKAMVSKINGLVIPGGGQPLRTGNSFFDAVHYLTRLAREANEASDHFPVHGTCLGFEAMACDVAGTDKILTWMDAENLPARMNFTPAAQDSNFLGSWPNDLLLLMGQEQYSMENHHWGLSLETFSSNANLSSFWQVLATSSSREGITEVAILEAQDYPFTAVQWHPEKNTFEFSDGVAIPKEPMALRVSYAAAQAFMSQARLNHHHVESKVEVDKLLIYNWAPQFSGKHRHEKDKKFFLQVYLFDDEDVESQTVLTRA
eukprot:jgi/Astpho2/600/e_gw1.00013.76.1_t